MEFNLNNPIDVVIFLAIIVVIVAVVWWAVTGISSWFGGNGDWESNFTIKKMGGSTTQTWYTVSRPQEGDGVDSARLQIDGVLLKITTTNGETFEHEHTLTEKPLALAPYHSCNLYISHKALKEETSKEIKSVEIKAIRYHQASNDELRLLPKQLDF